MWPARMGGGAMVRKKIWRALLVYALAVFIFVIYVWVAPYVRSLGAVKIRYERGVGEAAAEERTPRVLDGVVVATSTVNPALVAAVIDNQVDSRPASGAAKARVVYEVPVEGNITRFLALYPLDEVPVKVGPIRSARPYFLKWMAEFGLPLFLHVGGSEEALVLGNGRPFNTLNEYFNGRYFWRDSGRLRPHNVYTSRTLLEESGRATSTEYMGWRFEEGATSTPFGAEDGLRVRVVYSKPLYDVEWFYNKDEDVYTRLQAGAMQRDDDGRKITASTVIVQRVAGEVIDELGRLKVEVQGEGEAVVYKHGKKISGKWKRSVGEARTRFFDARGQEIALAPGVVWVEIVLASHRVE